MYGSSRSHLIVEFAEVPKKDKAELEPQLRNEKDAYDKLYRITGLVVPRCYRKYVWFGGRALVPSDEGPSLSGLGMEFTSLGPTERCHALQFEESSADFYVTDLSSLGSYALSIARLGGEQPRL